MIVFRFYRELDAVRSKNSELSHGILRILQILGEIKVYLRKTIVDLKKYELQKKFIFRQSVAVIATFADI